MADSVHTTVAPKIDRREVMRTAWESYRKQIADSDFPFSRKLFAAHLRSAWDIVRYMAYWTRRQAEEAAKLVSDNPLVRRAAEIRAELLSMEMGERIDWDRHRALSIELSRCAA